MSASLSGCGTNGGSTSRRWSQSTPAKKLSFLTSVTEDQVKKTGKINWIQFSVILKDVLHGGENKKLMFSFSGLKYKDINNAFVTLLQDLKRAINQFDIFYFILKIGVRPLFIIAAKLTSSAVIDTMQQGLRN